MLDHAFNCRQSLPKIKKFELSATIAHYIALPSQIMIHEQFYSRDGNAMILQKLHCRREKNIARVSVALYIVQV